jgi:heme oxygenase
VPCISHERLTIDRLGVITQQLHTLTDKDREASWDSSDYRRYLTRMYGFVLPVERSIQSTPHIGSYIDVRRFQKHELLRRDLMAHRMTPQQIEALALCAVPEFDTPEEAFGWASLIERNTLHHAGLFHRLASTNPGDAAFAASYLKCYSGGVGEMWKTFRHAVAAFQGTGERRERLSAATKAALRCYESWRLLHDRR